MADVQRRETEAMEVAEAAEGEATKRRVGNSLSLREENLPPPPAKTFSCVAKRNT